MQTRIQGAPQASAGSEQRTARVSSGALTLGSMRISELDRISFERDIMGGQACIRGMRIPVSLVLSLVAHGMSNQAILEEYPDLEPEDIRQSLEYAACLARDQIDFGQAL